MKEVYEHGEKKEPLISSRKKLLDQERQELLVEKALLIKSNPNYQQQDLETIEENILSGIPKIILWYGTHFNQKTIGGFLKRMVIDEGEGKVSLLSAEDTFKKQLADDWHHNAAKISKIAHAVLNYAPLKAVIEKVASTLGISLAKEDSGFDMLDAKIANTDTFAEWILKHGDAAATSLTSTISKEELTEMKALGAKAEESHETE